LFHQVETGRKSNGEDERMRRLRCDDGAASRQDLLGEPLQPGARPGFPTVAGICGYYGKQNCPACAAAPRFEDDPEFWGQVLGD
jgi:hypothetical protein